MSKARRPAAPSLDERIAAAAVSATNGDEQERTDEERERAKVAENAAKKYDGKNPTPVVRRDGGPGFGPGNQVSKGHGRPKGSVGGRAKTLRLIDAVFEQPEIQQALAKALVETVLTGNREALETLRTIVMPLTPKEVLVKADGPQGPEQRLGVRITVEAAGATATAEAEATTGQAAKEE